MKWTKCSSGNQSIMDGGNNSICLRSQGLNLVFIVETFYYIYDVCAVEFSDSLLDEEICDADGEPRFFFRTPNWEDFVQLSCIEIRHCGAGSVQIMRRMRSMLGNLMQTLPPHRHAELHKQLELLDRTIDVHYSFPEDLAIARIADSQGLGGTLGVQAAIEAPTAEGGGRGK